MEGGLGVLDLENMNATLLAKWRWRFLSDKCHLWSSLIEGIYYSRRKPLREGASFRPFSQWWRNVLLTRDIIKCGVDFVLGDEQTACFWSDIWAGQASLRTLFPNIHDRVRGKGCRVKECWGRNGWRSGKILGGFSLSNPLEREMVAELKEVISVSPTPYRKDEVRWRWALSQSFSVKSLYDFL